MIPYSRLMLALALGAAACTAQAAGGYSILDITHIDRSFSRDPQLPAISTAGHALNDRGQVVGVVTYSGTPFGADYSVTESRGFSWTAQGGAQTLAPQSTGNTGDITAAYGVNNAGQIVGRVYNDPYAPSGALWQPGAYGSAPTQRPGSRLDINDSGIAAGASPEGVAMIEDTQQGQGQTLGLLPGGRSSSAEAINEAGQVAGVADLSTGAKRAFRWTAEGGMQDLGVLPGTRDSVAVDINNAGHVVGNSYGAVPGGTWIDAAFVWTPEAGMQNLGSLGGGAVAYGINDQGQVVGRSNGQAFLWTAEAGMQSLNSLVAAQFPEMAYINFTQATAINQSGQILASGTWAGGAGTFLLTPVPEPATWALAGLGLCAAAALARRQRAG